MSNDLFGVVALVVILGIGAVAVGPAYVGGSDRVTVTNETITVDYDTEQSVDERGLRYDDAVTVRNASGSVLTNGTDYEWQPAEGNVTWFNTSATTAGNNATITYEYRAARSQQRITAGVISALGTALTFVLPLLAVGYIYRELV